jgi:very-short-patch-repair endonuclease
MRYGEGVPHRSADLGPRPPFAARDDGGQHAESAADLSRTRWLEREGYHVLRFWNNEVLTNIDGVLEIIVAKLRSIPGRF